MCSRSALSKATRLLKQQQEIAAELAQLREEVEGLTAEEQEELGEAIKVSLQTPPEESPLTLPDTPGATSQFIVRHSN